MTAVIEPPRRVASSHPEPPSEVAPSRSATEEDVDPLVEYDPRLNPLISRRYRAATRAAAAMLYSNELPLLARAGYVPADDSWEESGTPPGGVLWVTYIAKSIKYPAHVCTMCGSDLPS